MPSLERLHQHFKNEEFELIAISVGEKPDTVKSYIEKYGYTFLNILDVDTLVSAQYGIRSHPVKFFINKKGEVVGMAKGYKEWDNGDMKSLVSALIDN